MAGSADDALGVPGLEGAELIGSGGFALVYRADQPAFSRTVAVKVLGRLDEATQHRFEREVRVMGSLSEHPNIVTIFDAGATTHGSPYLLMAHMPGGSLADRIERHGAIPWKEAIAIGIQMAGALEMAHRRGVIHRDVKPANILVGSFGEPQLSDFGISRIAGAAETRSGVITASLVYAPPEVIDGGRPTVASDVYSLGATVFSLIAGQPAFVRDTDESMYPLLVRVQDEPVPDLRPQGVPGGICDAIEQAMAKEPAARQRSAAQFGRQLQAMQGELGIAQTSMLIDLENGGDAAEVDGPERAADQTGHSSLETIVVDDEEPSRSETEPVVDEVKRRWWAVLIVVAAVSGVGWLVVRDRGATTPAPVTVAATDASATLATEAPPSTPAPTTTPPTTTPTARVVEPLVTDVIDVGGAVFTPLFADGAIWAPVNGSSAVARVDLETLTVTHQIAMPGGPETPVFFDRAIWVPDIEAGVVARIDPRISEVTDLIPVGNNPFIPAVAAGALWVPNRDDDTLSRIDPETRLVTDTISITSAATTPTFAAGGLWLSAGTFVERVDTETRLVSDRIEVGAAQTKPTVAFGDLWVAGSGPDGRQVTRIDPVARAVVVTIPTPASGAVVEGAGLLWLVNSSDGTISSIDPAAAEVTGTYDIGGSPSTPMAFDGALWIPDRPQGVVRRFDMISRTVTHTLEVGSRPDTPLAADGVLWVSAIDAGNLLRIVTS